MKLLAKMSASVFATTLLLSVSVPDISSANVLANKVEAAPNLSNTLQITLIDLSRSVDKEVVVEGLMSIRKQIGNVYEQSGGNYNSPAASYYFWLPILGQNDRKDFYPLFSSKIDKDIWGIVRATVNGKDKQANTLEKIRSESGLWRELIFAGSVEGCLNYVAQTLKTPGLFGSSIVNLSKGICEQAIVTRNNIAKMQKTVKEYLSGVKENDGGSDIIGAIDRIDDEMNSSLGLKRYKKINLVFVTDGVNNTSTYRLQKLLLEQGVDSCALGAKAVEGKPRYSPSKVFVKMYGLGEGNKDVSKNDQLRLGLRKYWQCYWKAKGIPNPEFGQLSELGTG